MSVVSNDSDLFRRRKLVRRWYRLGLLFVTAMFVLSSTAGVDDYTFLTHSITGKDSNRKSTDCQNKKTCGRASRLNPGDYEALNRAVHG